MQNGGDAEISPCSRRNLRGRLWCFIDLFQSLAFPLPLTDWNSFGVIQVLSRRIQEPRLPPRRSSRLSCAQFEPQLTSKRTGILELVSEVGTLDGVEMVEDEGIVVYPLRVEDAEKVGSVEEVKQARGVEVDEVGMVEDVDEIEREGDVERMEDVEEMEEAEMVGSVEDVDRL